MIQPAEHRRAADSREIGTFFLFDPREGQTVFRPPGSGTGYWAGAPSVTYDPLSKRFYLYRRIRQPHPIRGGECRVAESEDGVHFSDIWAMTKQQLDGSPSIERGALVRAFEGDWLLYVSYVDPADGRWRIDVMRSKTPDGFDPRSRKPVFTAASTGTQGVKDPVVYKLGGEYYMFYCYAPSPPDVDEDLFARMHETADVFNTGLVVHHSALAVSRDGERFTPLGDVLVPPKEGWDRDTVRTTSVLWMPPYFVMLYDGKASVRDNYEERCGYAIGFDLLRWRRVTVDGPALISPWGSGSLRYVDAITVDGRLYAYYEMSCPDGSHELRVNVVEPATV